MPAPARRSATGATLCPGTSPGRGYQAGRHRARSGYAVCAGNGARSLAAATRPLILVAARPGSQLARRVLGEPSRALLARPRARRRSASPSATASAALRGGGATRGCSSSRSRSSARRASSACTRSRRRACSIGKNAGFELATPVGLVLAGVFAAVSSLELPQRVRRRRAAGSSAASGCCSPRWGFVSIAQIWPLDSPVALEELDG